MQNDYAYYFNDGYVVEKEIKVRLNKVIDHTNLWYELKPKEYTFFSIEQVNDRLQQDDGSGDLMRFKVILDNRSAQIERKIYTIYEMLGQVGGFIGMIFGIGSIFVGFFSNNIYLMSLLTSLFKIQKSYKKKSDKEMDSEVVKSNIKKSLTVHNFEEVKSPEIESFHNLGNLKDLENISKNAVTPKNFKVNNVYTKLNEDVGFWKNEDEVDQPDHDKEKGIEVDKYYKLGHKLEAILSHRQIYKFEWK